MFIIIWEFTIDPINTTTFEEAYGSNGIWAALFRKANGFVETKLLKADDAENRYMTFDCWKSKEQYIQFKESYTDDYRILDEQCEMLTSDERLIGYFIDVL